jgi:hypothetical protein
MPFSFGDEELNLDDAVSAFCTVTKGDLPLKLFWSFKRKGSETSVNLTTGDGIYISKAGQRSISINIDAIKSHMVGTYQCVASNVGGSMNQSAYLSINGSKFYSAQSQMEIFRRILQFLLCFLSQFFLLCVYF